MGAVLVLSTAGSPREGRRIARALVEKKLAACVNVIPGVVSFFPWKGRISVQGEVLLVVKTTLATFRKLLIEIKNLNSYDLPEIIFFKADGGEERYLQWVEQAVPTRKGRGAKKIIDNQS